MCIYTYSSVKMVKYYLWLKYSNLLLFCNLPLFVKYITIGYLFKTQFRKVDFIKVEYHKTSPHHSLFLLFSSLVSLAFLLHFSLSHTHKACETSFVKCETVQILELWNSADPEVRASPANLSNFCTVWRMNSNFYFLSTHFFKYTLISNRFSIPFSILFKYYFFIHYLFFF